MGTMTFLDDTINEVPGTGAGSATVTVAPDGNNNYTFNPFNTTGSFASTATVVDAGGADNLTLRLIFTDQAGDDAGDGMKLFNYVGGSFVQDSGTWAGVGGSYVQVNQGGAGSTINSVASTNGTAAQVEGWRGCPDLC